MAVKFIGDCEWKQTFDLQWTVDGWGVDRCIARFLGRRDKMVQFKNSIVKFHTMTNYPAMRLNSWSNSGGSVSLPTIDLEYVGFRSGRVPRAKSQNSYVTQSVSGSGKYSYVKPDEDTPTIVDISANFTYRASRTSWTWFEVTKPNRNKPRFSTVLEPVDPLTSIISYSVIGVPDDATASGAAGFPITNVPYSAFVTVFNSLRRVVVISDYTTEVILPNALWACSCSVDYRLDNANG